MPVSKKPKKIQSKANIQKWLKDKGHKAAKVNSLKLSNAAEMKKELFELHGLLTGTN